MESACTWRNIIIYTSRDFYTLSLATCIYEGMTDLNITTNVHV